MRDGEPINFVVSSNDSGESLRSGHKNEKNLSTLQLSWSAWLASRKSLATRSFRYFKHVTRPVIVPWRKVPFSSGMERILVISTYSETIPTFISFGRCFVHAPSSVKVAGGAAGSIGLGMEPAAHHRRWHWWKGAKCGKNGSKLWEWFRCDSRDSRYGLSLDLPSCRSNERRVRKSVMIAQRRI